MKSKTAKDFLDIPKAKELTKILLENDVRRYNKFLPYIQSMNDEDFANLFIGDIEYGKYPIQHIDFTELIKKFNNYHSIIEELYESKENHKYLVELWIHYISIEDLRKLEKEKIEEELEKNEINCKSWPTKIKDQIINIIKETLNTIIIKLKDWYANLTSSMKSFLQELTDFSNKSQNENTNWDKNGNPFTQICKEIDLKIALQCSGVCNVSYDLIKQIKNRYFKPTNKKFEIKSSIKNIKNGISKDKMWNKIKNKMAPVMSLLLSTYNVWEAYKDCDIIKEADNIHACEEELAKIHEEFNECKKDLGTIGPIDDLKAYESRLILIKNRFKIVYERIVKLIEDIDSAIKKQEQYEKDNKKKCLKNGLEAAISFTSCFTAEGIFNKIMYGASGAINAFSTYKRFENIKEIQEIIKKLKDIKIKAEKEKKDIEDEMRKLKEMVGETVKDNNESFPKFITSK